MFRRIGDLLDDYKGLPHEAHLLNNSSFFNWLAPGLFFSTMQVFLLLQGVGLATSGLMLTALGVTSAVSSLFFGSLADRHGRRKFVITGGVLAAVSIAVFGIVPATSSTGLTVLFGAVIVGGLSEAMFASSWGAMLADKATDSKRTSAFSLSFFISAVSAAVGGFSAIVLTPFASDNARLVLGHRYLYVGIAALSLLGPIIVSRVAEPAKLKPRTERRSFLPRKSRRPVLQYSVAGILVALGAGMVIPNIGGWALLKFQVKDDVSAPVLGGLNSLVMGVANLVTPRLAQRLGTVKTIVLTQGASTLFLFSLPFTPTFPIASGIFITRSTLMMMSNPTEQSFLMGLVPEDERSTASSITAALWRLPNSITTGLGAYIMSLGGFFYLGLPFWLCTLLYLSSISYFWHAFKNVRLPEERVLVPLPAAT